MQVVIHKTRPDRKLKAVVSTQGFVWFKQSSSDTVWCLSVEGLNKSPTPSLEELIVTGNDRRQPVYEGDSITITF